MQQATDANQSAHAEHYDQPIMDPVDHDAVVVQDMTSWPQPTL